MKKFIIVLVVVLAVLGGGAFGYYKHIQTGILTSMDEELIPAVKQQYKQMYGHEPKISYGQAVMDGRKITVSDIVFRDDKLKVKATVQKNTASLLGWDWLWSDFRFSLLTNDALIESSASKIDVKQAYCPEIILSPDGSQGSFKDFLIKNIVLTKHFKAKTKNGKPKKETLEFGDLKVGRGNWQNNLEGKYRLDAQSIEAGNKKLLIKLASLNSQAHYPPDQPSQIGWPVCTSEGKLSGLEVSLDGKPVFIFDEMTSLTKLESSTGSHQTQVRGMRLPKELMAKAKEMLDLGYDQVKADLTMDMDYDFNQGLFRYKNFMLDAPDMGAFSFSLEIPGLKIDHKFFDQIDEKKVMALLDKVAVKSFRLRYTDKSLVPKLFKSYAAKQKLDEKAVKNQAIFFVGLAGAAFEKDSQGAKVIEAVVNFIKDPKELCFTANPKTPVRFKELGGQNPTQIVEMLNVEAKCQ